MRSQKNYRPLVIAHRGIRNRFPENTLPAIENALTMGVDGIEFDVEISSDNVPVLIHQETLLPDKSFKALERAPSDSGRDWVISHPSTGLMRLDCGTWHSKDFSTTRIPSLAEICKLDWGAVHMFCELKDPAYFSKGEGSSRAKKIVSAVLPFLKGVIERGINLSVISFSMPVLLELADKSADISRLLAGGDSGLPEQAVKALDCGAQGLVLPIRIVSKSDEEGFNSQGDLKVFLYESSRKNLSAEPSSALRKEWDEALALGVDGIITDYAAELSARINQP